MKLETLCFLAGLETPPDPRVGVMEISSVTCNSRACVPGCIYVCILGTKADGHAFIEEALAKGAVAVVTERDHPIADGFVKKRNSAIFIPVTDTRAAIARLFDAWYGHPARGMSLIAVTGTNGKTSVSTMIKAMLDAAMIPAGLIGTVRCVCRDRVLDIRSADETANLTTPDPEQLYHILAVMAAEGVRTVVMETSSHALALKKLEPLCFDAAIFTNLSPEHLDFHGDMEHYFAAKASLLAKTSLAIINADDAYAPRMRECCYGRVVTTSCGLHDADYVASDVHVLGVEGITYTLLGKNSTAARLSSPIPGAFTVSNTLQAAACALQLGVPLAAVRDGLRHSSGIAGRMERVRLPVPVSFSVFIDYAHTPDALENLLRTAREFRQKQQRVVLLFGCGGDRDRSKRPLMAQVAARFADVIYLTSDNSRSEDPTQIFSDIAAGFPQGIAYTLIPDRAEAIATAIRNAAPGDIILLAGKGHETYEIDGAGKHHFDERTIVAAAVAAAFPRGRLEKEE